MVEIRWAQAARRHRIGRAHALHVMTTTPGRPIQTVRGEDGLLFIGVDDRGLELEVIAAVVTAPDGQRILLVIPRHAHRVEEAAMTKPIILRTPTGQTIEATDAGDAGLSPAGESHAEALAADLLEAAGRPLPEHLRGGGRPSLHGGPGHSPQVAFRLPAGTRARAEALAAARGITVSELARQALERELAG